MKKGDIIAVLILGEIVAIFLGLILRGFGFSLFPIWILYIAFPVVAVIANFICYLTSKKIPVIFQFAKYVTVGLANTAVDFGVLNLIMWTTGVYQGKSVILFNTISFLVAVTNSYIWNKFWTFKAKDKSNIPAQFIQFVIVSIIGVLINTGIVYIGSSLISPMFGFSANVWTNVAKVLATVVSLIWNFAGYKFIVFKKKDMPAQGGSASG